MPVRKIPRSFRSVTGLLTSRKIGRMIASESTLERDLYTHLDFDPLVRYFEEQPCVIEYENKEGKKARYTPDVIIEFNQGTADARHSLFAARPPVERKAANNVKGSRSFRLAPTQPILGEVKYRTDLLKNWPVLKPKFKAARQFAREKGWKFCIFTESEMRGVLLDNLKFLRSYQNPAGLEDEMHRVRTALSELRQTTPRLLLGALAQDKFEQARLIPALWHLVGTVQIVVDLRQPLTMNIPLSLNESAVSFG